MSRKTGEPDKPSLLDSSINATLVVPPNSTIIIDTETTTTFTTTTEKVRQK